MFFNCPPGYISATSAGTTGSRAGRCVATLVRLAADSARTLSTATGHWPLAPRSSCRVCPHHDHHGNHVHPPASRSMFGCGVLSLSHAFEQSGLVNGIVAYCLIAGICSYTMTLIIECKHMLQPPGIFRNYSTQPSIPPSNQRGFFGTCVQWRKGNPRCVSRPCPLPVGSRGLPCRRSSTAFFLLFFR